LDPFGVMCISWRPSNHRELPPNSARSDAVSLDALPVRCTIHWLPSLLARIRFVVPAGA
jgi:hypothetical protein